MIKKLTSGLFAAALVMALPLTADAQEAVVPGDEAEAEVCTATVAPIHAAESVVVTAAFDAPFGKVVGIEAPASSELRLVQEQPTEMADEAIEGEIDAEPTPLGEENLNVSTFSLNSADAAPGTYLVTLNSETGERCTAEITVEGTPVEETPADESNDDEWNESEDSEDTEDGEEY